jgi:tripartite-type tricarboxylate transporter receptor subunit TctC
VLLLAAGAVCAQEQFPNKPIRILVGFTAGSVTDFLARAVGHKHEVARILALQDVKERMLTQCATSHPISPEEFDAFIKYEVTRMGKIIKDAGMRID